MAGQAFGVIGLEVMGRNIALNIERNGFPIETVRELKRAYRLLFRSELNVSQALETATADAMPIATECSKLNRLQPTRICKIAAS